MTRAFWLSLAETELEEILRYIRDEGQRPETARRLAVAIPTPWTSMHVAACPVIGIQHYLKAGSI
jgi:hypothetical protein